MPTFRYNTTGAWFKGNTHIHSTASDGGKTLAELGRMYADAGYHFLCRTDHWVPSDWVSDTETSPLTWIDGMELDGPDRGGSQYHVVCLGRFTGIEREMGFVPALESARRQGGLLILAHPYWMGNSTEDALRWGFHGVEIYNHVCHWLNGKSDGLTYWSAMLGRFPNTLAFAADDAHIRAEHPFWDGGWIWVNAPDRTPDSLLASIRAGNFYASCGPEIHALEFEGGTVTARTSPIRFARLVGPAWNGLRLAGPDGGTMEEVSFEIPSEWPYAYIEIEDTQNRRAWTNPLFVAET